MELGFADSVVAVGGKVATARSPARSEAAAKELLKVSQSGGLKIDQPNGRSRGG